jgi:hypothetical protein
MRCEDALIEIGPSLTGVLDPEQEARVREHLAECADCQAEYLRLREVWDGLAALPAEVPDSTGMQRRFLTALDSFQTGADQARVQMLSAPDRRPSWSSVLTWWAMPAALAAGLLIGVLIGRGPASAPPPASTDLALLRQELHDTRELVTLSLLRQTSASDRLRGVSWTGRIDDPGVEVVSALLDALSHDPNVNVRLAAVDALARFSDRPTVRNGAVAALADGGSPLVQIALIDLLVQVKEPSSRDTLRKLAGDLQIDEAVRDHAAWGLQQLG